MAMRSAYEKDLPLLLRFVKFGSKWELSFSRYELQKSLSAA